MDTLVKKNISKKLGDWDVPDFEMKINDKGVITVICNSKSLSLSEYLKIIYLNTSSFHKSINSIKVLEGLSSVFEQFKVKLEKSRDLLEQYSKKKIKTSKGYKDIYKKIGKGLLKYSLLLSSKFNTNGSLAVVNIDDKKEELLVNLKNLIAAIEGSGSQSNAKTIDVIAIDAFAALKEYVILLTAISAWDMASKTSNSRANLSDLANQLQNPEKIKMDNSMSSSVKGLANSAKNRVSSAMKNVSLKFKSSRVKNDEDPTVRV